MKKIPTVFERDEVDRRYVTDRPNPACDWVFASEGTATRKYDGTCVMLADDGEWWARREVKPGKSAPAGYQLVDEDAATGKAVGWEPIAQSAFAKWHAEAIGARDLIGTWKPGTYELIGPKVNGNPERQEHHVLVRHEYADEVQPFALTFERIRDLALRMAELHGWEGFVWHHPDGRMAKIKARDFRAGIQESETTR